MMKNYMKKSVLKVLDYSGTIALYGALLLLLTISVGCGGPSRFQPPPALPDDRMDIPQPRESEINIVADSFDMQVTEQLDQLLDFSRHFRKLAGRPKQSMNADAFGEVPSSSWFTNRNAVHRMTIEEIKRGPDTGTGPDMENVWNVVSAKAEGVTPGFQIVDGRGDRYLIKFDPPGHPELITGAEVVSTKLLYAAGYHVPENYVVYFHPRILRLKEEVKFTDKKGRKRFMTQADLDEIIERLDRLPDGRIRAVASKFLKGKPLGPFKYKGIRKDDPNDIIPHHHRRELRGLRVIAAWLAHFDTKSSNSLDMYVTEGGRSYVRHYLIDFGSTLGAGARGPVKRPTGHENFFDPHEITKNVFTLGLYVRPYEKAPDPEYPSVGRYDAELFHPHKYKPYVPNPAFENLTGNDGFWAAKIVMSFTDEQLEAAVAAGDYSDPNAAAYILRMLIERRNLVGRYWFSRMNPLDGFEIRSASSGKSELCFADLANEGGLESGSETRYKYELLKGGQTIVSNDEMAASTCLELPVDPGSDETYFEAKIQTRRGSNAGWSKWVKVFIEFDRASGEYVLLGLEREE
ncbi:MAG: hypothetical protein GTO42_02350 [Candidatus Latescibacteria bacterium]|nr:hypothetical protein [Candidatus Latescibacterota bacterium]NIO00977.1 hypothetical protein [Candidatus Latescibacterota bacterium]NIO27376.1 hypothetical protein [Candidatus Latescibacterota bacterium]NIO54898.1 hypothetical protein [Candidatus Latescibacterota bacterium]NIT00987.1 hypothetical protein [Candidatus Latescibacterota bacterium]